MKRIFKWLLVIIGIPLLLSVILLFSLWLKYYCIVHVEPGNLQVTKKPGILENKYGFKYDGLDGNDDSGTLSAWYVFSALGFYPIAGIDIYQLGSPLFKKAELNLGDNRLTIIADNYSTENIYINKIWLNDTLLDRTWFKHKEIANGGVIRFKMSDKP